MIIADSDPLLSLKSAHDDRYEEFEAFMKAQREFNNKIESQISMNSVALNENVIELQDLEHKCKNLTKEVKLSCERRIEEVRSEIGEEIQKLVKQIASLNSKLSSELKILKNKASSTEDSIKLILHQLDQIKTKVSAHLSNHSWSTYKKPARHQQDLLVRNLHHHAGRKPLIQKRYVRTLRLRRTDTNR